MAKWWRGIKGGERGVRGEGVKKRGGRTGRSRKDGIPGGEVAYIRKMMFLGKTLHKPV